MRTQETQSRLLSAAEEVFVREGYEAAQLDEIAATAGRSKGAVYTHFKSKEDLFLALFEHRTRYYIERFHTALQLCATREQGREAFRTFYVDLVRDRAWHILTLEFKLYALRHPESKERLQKAFEMIRATGDPALHGRVFGSLTQHQKVENEAAISALGPTVSALILESYFEPATLSEETLRLLLGRIFDALFPTPP
jgi:AcrR family transcriptional regulator